MWFRDRRLWRNFSSGPFNVIFLMENEMFFRISFTHFLSVPGGKIVPDDWRLCPNFLQDPKKTQSDGT